MPEAILLPPLRCPPLRLRSRESGVRARPSGLCRLPTADVRQDKPPTTNTSMVPKTESSKTERGTTFIVGECFYRQESALGRDLGVLSAALYKRSRGALSVLDAMCGCGVRSLRYLTQSDADFVWANDANDDSRRTILENLSQEVREVEGRRRWVVTHSDANRLMVERYLNSDYFDLIDIDSFGSDSSFLRSAFAALKLDGLLYLTSTDGYSSGGHRPQHSLASYGAYVRPMPYSNEVGLRMLVGGAVREAAALGFQISPLFSYYSYHGPVFRVMLQVSRGQPLEHGHYGFISYCTRCGNSRAFSWKDLGKMFCICSKNEVSHSLVVSGPLWTGPLHNADHIRDLLSLADQWGWTNAGVEGKNLDKLLRQMHDESDPRLPFGYIKLDEVASRAKVNSPPLKVMMDVLHQEGYAVSRSHIRSNAIKTNCPMTMCVQIAQRIKNDEFLTF
ncbi:tRNA (guanine(26)-N(2))-dimethyltransferase isoform X1 [Nymphaea colorata]|nr:tRNA (guanine(26)-N(2))-dimethyltransferase isoform X1 [Nymphaea colorata]